MIKMTEDEIKKMMEKHGYTLDKIVYFKNSDRIRYHSNNRDLKVSLNLAKKIGDIPLEAFERWMV